MAESSSDWSGTLFRSADLSHANLEGATALEVCFDSADLHETNFQCAKLSRSSFLHASFSRSRLNQKIHNSRFCNAIMNGCILDGTNISYLFFQDADLSYALIRNSHIENTVFLNCKLQNADMDSAVAIGAYFLLSDLSGINLAGIVANNSHFSSLKVSGIQNHHLEEIISSALGSPEKEKENTTLNGANLKAAELHQAEMMGVDLSGALLQGASLLEANLSGANCLAAQFAAADLKSTNFNLADLTACDLSSAGCNPETSFREAILIDTNLSGVDLSGIRFELTNLNGADLSDCRLDGAEFIGKPEHFVDLARSDLRTTSLNNTTFKYAYLDRCDLSFSRGDH
jgi:uncharacterized protein YjbI with pentapeptide repeats